VADAELPAGRGVDRRDVGRAVVGHQPLYPDAGLGEPGDRPAQEARRGLAALVGQQLDEGEPGGVIDGDVAALPALAAT
jgi:hypothetical protein